MTGRWVMTAATALAWTMPAAAQTEPAAPAPASRAAQSADRFSLELVAPEGEPAPVASAPVAPAAEAPLPGIAAKPRFSADTPIKDLLANYRSKSVIDRDMPGLSSDKNLGKFSELSLRQLKPLSGGRLTDQLLDKVDADLAAIK